MKHLGSEVIYKPYTLSLKNASNYTSLSVRTLWNLIKADSIKTTKCGRKTLILTRSLEKYLDGNAVC